MRDFQFRFQIIDKACHKYVKYFYLNSWCYCFRLRWYWIPYSWRKPIMIYFLKKSLFISNYDCFSANFVFHFLETRSAPEPTTVQQFSDNFWIKIGIIYFTYFNVFFKVICYQILRNASFKYLYLNFDGLNSVIIHIFLIENIICSCRNPLDTYIRKFCLLKIVLNTAIANSLYTFFQCILSMDNWKKGVILFKMSGKWSDCIHCKRHF